MKIVVFTMLIVFGVPAIADKPDWAGEGKPTVEDKAAHKAAMNAKEDGKGKDKSKKSRKGEKEQGEKSGKSEKSEKDKSKKSEKSKKDKQARSDKERDDSQRKELAKGSDQGQAQREEKSRKWWRFWES